jgi:hypothetical protein
MAVLSHSPIETGINLKKEKDFSSPLFGKGLEALENAKVLPLSALYINYFDWI